MAENRVAIDGAASTGSLPVTVTAGSVGPLYYTSSGASGNVAAPGAGVNIATITPAAGLYDVEVFISMNGTLASGTDTSNMNLKFGSTTILANIPYSANGTSNPVAGPFRTRINADGSTAVTVNAVAAATASSKYQASITLTRVG